MHTYLGQVYEKAGRQGMYTASRIMQLARAVVVVYGPQRDRKRTTDDECSNYDLL